MNKQFAIAMMAIMSVGVGSASAHTKAVHGYTTVPSIHNRSVYGYPSVPYYAPFYHVPQTVRRCMWEPAWEWMPYARNSKNGRYVLTQKQVCRDYLN